MPVGTMHLVGGGVDSIGTPTLLAPFVEAVLARARASRARIALVLADDTGLAARFRPEYVAALEANAPDRLDFVDTFVGGRTPIDPDALRDVDGVVVGGGPAPVYLDALAPAAPTLRDVVTGGVPYLGLSAGSMVAASTALAGGWRLGDRAVCDEDWSEELGELEVRRGLGLVPFTVDVHTSQAGLLGRTSSLLQLGGVEHAVGIDEDTCLTVAQDRAGRVTGQVHGRGFVWDVRRGDDDAVLLRRFVSGQALPLGDRG